MRPERLGGETVGISAVVVVVFVVVAIVLCVCVFFRSLFLWYQGGQAGTL